MSGENEIYTPLCRLTEEIQTGKTNNTKIRFFKKRGYDLKFLQSILKLRLIFTFRTADKHFLQGDIE